MRLEDLGKKLLVDAPILDTEIILQKFNDFFNENQTAEYFLLLSRDVEYYTVFKRSKGGVDAESLLEYFSNSWFALPDATDELVQMDYITFIELREDGCLEIWIHNIYFHLTPFDWGVEQL